MSGYLTLSFLMLTPLLALASDWVAQNSSAVERGVIGTGLAVAGVGAFARVQCVVGPLVYNAGWQS